MKITSSPSKRFTPIKFEIIVEDERELAYLLALTNCSFATVRDVGARSWPKVQEMVEKLQQDPKSDMQMDLYHAVNEQAVAAGVVN